MMKTTASTRALKTLSTLSGFWSTLNLPYPVLLAAWLLVMIALPVVTHMWGEAGLRAGIVSGVLLQAALVLALLYAAWGLARTMRVAVPVVALTWVVEAAGSATGIPFGSYYYTAKLQPHLAGVPLVIPLAWLMMLPPAWAVADRLTRGRRGFGFVAASAAAMTAWDLFLDPQMVAWGLWVWEQPGGYFGIPWENYLGWLLAAGLITGLVRPGQLPVRPLLLIYGITWVLETIGLLFFWGLPGPAAAGFGVMGALFWLAWRRSP